MKKLWRIAVLVIPTTIFLLTAASMYLGIRNLDLSIATLRTMIEDKTEEPAVEVFEPVDVDHHYPLSGYKILLSDDTYGEIWIPVLEGVRLSTHPLSRLEMLPNGRMTSYNEKGEVNVMTGIDISSHNEVTDWNKVKADGIDFVMLRVGVRKYGSGKIYADEKFQSYYRGAKDAGLKVGAYFFSQAISEEEAVEEAQLTAKQLEGLELDFPVAFDWEIIYDEGETARTDNVPCDVLTDCTLAFCENIKAWGWEPMIYQNKRTSLFKLDLPRLQGIPFWLAEYREQPTFVYDFDMWQFGCTGRVDGIIGSVDMNLSFYDYSQEGNPPIANGKPAQTAPAETTDTGTGTSDTTTHAAADMTTQAVTDTTTQPAAETTLSTENEKAE